MKTNYAQRPERYEVIHLPDGKCEVLLWENITEARGGNGALCYTADEYTIITPWREGLEEAVNGNTAAWLEAAKNTERAQLAKEVREHRNKLLADVDWTQTIDAPLSAQSRAAVREYRQALRDVTERKEFPYIDAWPKAPVIRKED